MVARLRGLPARELALRDVIGVASPIPRAPACGWPPSTAAGSPSAQARP